MSDILLPILVLSFFILLCLTLLFRSEPLCPHCRRPMMDMYYKTKGWKRLYCQRCDHWQKYR